MLAVLGLGFLVNCSLAKRYWVHNFSCRSLCGLVLSILIIPKCVRLLSSKLIHNNVHSYNIYKFGQSILTTSSTFVSLIWQSSGLWYLGLKDRILIMVQSCSCRISNQLLHPSRIRLWGTQFEPLFWSFVSVDGLVYFRWGLLGCWDHRFCYLYLDYIYFIAFNISLYICLRIKSNLQYKRTKK